MLQFITLSPSQGSSSQGLFTACCIGPLNHPYLLLHFLILLNIFYQSSLFSFSFHSSTIPFLYSYLSSSILFRNEFLLYFENRFLFHYLQFFSIRFQYFLLYFLFPHLLMEVVKKIYICFVGRKYGFK